MIVQSICSHTGKRVNLQLAFGVVIYVENECLHVIKTRLCPYVDYLLVL